MSDLEAAKSLLFEGGYTLVLKGEETITSHERGVRPLMGLLREGKDVRGYSAADLVIGRAAAFLYVLLGVKEVYGKIVSNLAKEVLIEHGIAVEAQIYVERIMSFAGGNCPMETAVEGIADANEAYAAIKAKIAEMMRK